MENFRLRVFRSVARHLNFRVAAEELLLTQPAVSQQIKTLEAELGAALFDRTGGRITLTAAGLALAPYADQLWQLAQQARAAVAGTTGGTAGELALGASQTIGQYLLPRLVAAFLAQHPSVQLQIQGGNTQQVLELLRQKRIQIAMIEGPALGNDVLVTPFLEDQMVCVVPAGHEWAEQDVPIESLKEAMLLMREQGSGSKRIVELALEKAGLPLRQLRFGLSFDSTEGLLSAVEAGLGIAFVSHWAVRNQLALGTLKLAHLRGLRLSRMFSLASLAGPQPAGTAGVFARFVLDRAQALGQPQARSARAGLNRNPSSVNGER